MPLSEYVIRDGREIAAAEEEQLTSILEQRGLPVVSGSTFLRRRARGLSVVLDLPGHLLNLRQYFLRALHSDRERRCGCDRLLGAQRLRNYLNKAKRPVVDRRDDTTTRRMPVGSIPGS